jgi:hypothetical protein
VLRKFFRINSVKILRIGGGHRSFISGAFLVVWRGHRHLYDLDTLLLPGAEGGLFLYPAAAQATSKQGDRGHSK